MQHLVFILVMFQETTVELLLYHTAAEDLFNIGDAMVQAGMAEESDPDISNAKPNPQSSQTGKLVQSATSEVCLSTTFNQTDIVGLQTSAVKTIEVQTATFLKGNYDCCNLETKTDTLKCHEKYLLNGNKENTITSSSYIETNFSATHPWKVNSPSDSGSWTTISQQTNKSSSSPIASQDLCHPDVLLSNEFTGQPVDTGADLDHVSKAFIAMSTVSGFEHVCSESTFASENYLHQNHPSNNGTSDAQKANSAVLAGHSDSSSIKASSVIYMSDERSDVLYAKLL